MSYATMLLVVAAELAAFAGLVVFGVRQSPPPARAAVAGTAAAAGHGSRSQPSPRSVAGLPPWAPATRPDRFWPGMLPRRYDDPGLSVSDRVVALYDAADQAVADRLPAWCREPAQEGTA